MERGSHWMRAGPKSYNWCHNERSRGQTHKHRKEGHKMMVKGTGRMQ